MCLFTCASTRAVHLELTRGLSVESFLLAFRKFTSRRGLPATITSDNAKTFRSSSQDIRKITRAEEVWRYLANKQITWNFIVEKGPVVGRILGKACEKHQETLKEDPREVYTPFWWVGYCLSGDRSSHQFQTPNVRVRWRGVHLLPFNAFPFDLRSTNHINSERFSLWSNQYQSIAHKEVPSS